MIVSGIKHVPEYVRALDAATFAQCRVRGTLILHLNLPEGEDEESRKKEIRDHCLRFNALPLTVGTRIALPAKAARGGVIDLRKQKVPREGNWGDVRTLGPVGHILQPGEAARVMVREYLYLPPQYMAWLSDNSHAWRLGLSVHLRCDRLLPDYFGSPVVQVTNEGQRAVRLYPGLQLFNLTVEEFRHGKVFWPETSQIPEGIMWGNDIDRNPYLA